MADTLTLDKAQNITTTSALLAGFYAGMDAGKPNDTRKTMELCMTQSCTTCPANTTCDL